MTQSLISILRGGVLLCVLAAFMVLPVSAQPIADLGRRGIGKGKAPLIADVMRSVPSGDTIREVRMLGRWNDSVSAGSALGFQDNTPRISADGHVMFFNSTRYGGRSWGRFRSEKGCYDSDIYFTIRDTTARGADVWSEPVNLGPVINTGEDDAVESISPNGGTIYFSSLRKGWVVQGGPFYRADMNPSREWKNAHGLGGGITDFFKKSTLFRIYGASVGAYGDVIYFATTAHSEGGDQEIWVSHLQNGVWSYPKNLGPVINTPGGSYAPYIAADGTTLYYTSGKSGGYGGGDVYVSVLRGSEWQDPANLGSTVNTAGDDAFFSIPASGDRVYLSHARGCVGGITSSPLAEHLRPSSIILMTGAVVDKGTRAALDATVTIEDLQARTTMQRSVGSGINNRFAAVLLPGRDYGISVSSPGYGFYSIRYTVPKNVNYKEVRQDIELEKLQQGNSFALNNLFFDYNSDDLSSASFLELDRLLALLQEKPAIRIIVSGHTDNIGSEKFNADLSGRRADAVRKYLIDSGKLDPSRIATKAYGASLPTAPNDTKEGRQMNRCVRFTILSM
ncbi:MAG: OmpA family protein [Candidatus Kapaibacterium sp.]